MNRKDVNIDGVNFTLTELGSYGFGIGVRKWKEKYDKEHFIIKTVHRDFNKNLYYFPHTPIVVDDVYNQQRFAQHSNLRVLDMPIKFPGSNDYRIPKELNQFDELISKCVAFEHTINPYVTQHYYAYITVDQGQVAPNTTQRKGGFHVDGFQGARIKNKRPVNRSYIVYDNTPTVFSVQGFRTDHLREDTDNFFLSFDEQSKEENEVTYDPYQILLMNAYTVHRAATNPKPVYRTFFRLSFDTIIFDRFGNTHNPMFPYNWNMVTRDTQKHLTHRQLPKHHPDAF